MILDFLFQEFLSEISSMREDLSENKIDDESIIENILLKMPKL